MRHQPTCLAAYNRADLPPSLLNEDVPEQPLLRVATDVPLREHADPLHEALLHVFGRSVPATRRFSHSQGPDCRNYADIMLKCSQFFKKYW